MCRRVLPKIYMHIYRLTKSMNALTVQASTWFSQLHTCKASSNPRPSGQVCLKKYVNNVVLKVEHLQFEAENEL